VRKGIVLAAVMAFVMLTIAAVYVVAREFGDVPLTLPTSRECVVGTEPDGKVSVTAEQTANAATIAAVGIRRGVPRRGVVIALATAWQESKLINLAGGDRDSLGLFQQRPSQDWGTPEQISDPRYAAGAFYTALLKVRGWQEMRITDAAQAVQRSAYPEAYEQWADNSEVLTAALTGEAGSAVGCTVNSDPPSRGAIATEALVKGLKLDWGEVRSAVQQSTVTVTVRNQKAGWQYAHWLVAHASGRGVRKVRFGDQEWNAKSGNWTKADASAAPVGGNSVLAEVHS
jgi:hypothetical protein